MSTRPPLEVVHDLIALAVRDQLPARTLARLSAAVLPAPHSQHGPVIERAAADAIEAATRAVGLAEGRIDPRSIADPQHDHDDPDQLIERLIADAEADLDTAARLLANEPPRVTR